MQKILIYRDFGQTYDSVYYLNIWLKDLLGHKFKIEFTDATSIINLNALDSNVAALFMPGGNSKGFYAKLGSTGNNKIIDFVKHGGLYYGICAGAYYACKNIEFSADSYNIQSKNTLNLVNATAIGSIPQLCDDNLYDNSAFSSTACKLKLNNGETCYAFYSGGPSFIGNNLDCIATYSQLNHIDNSKAIIKANYFEGKAILVATHPEYTQTAISRQADCLHYDELQQAHLRDIASKLNYSQTSNQTNALNKLILSDLL